MQNTETDADSNDPDLPNDRGSVPVDAAPLMPTPIVVHHHDIEKHAESYNEGYAAAERQATEPLPGYDEPDGNDPQHVEFAANVLQSIDHLTQIDATTRLVVAARLHDRAIRLRRDEEDRAAKWAAHEAAVDELAHALVGVIGGDITWEELTESGQNEKRAQARALMLCGYTRVGLS